VVGAEQTLAAPRGGLVGGQLLEQLELPLGQGPPPAGQAAGGAEQGGHQGVVVLRDPLGRDQPAVDPDPDHRQAVQAPGRGGQGLVESRVAGGGEVCGALPVGGQRPVHPPPLGVKRPSDGPALAGGQRAPGGGAALAGGDGGG